MRLLYNKGDRPAQNDIEEGDDVYNLPDSKRYTKTHSGDIVQIDSSPLTGYKNLLINGGFDVWQRTEQSGYNAYFGPDRFKFVYGNSPIDLYTVKEDLNTPKIGSAYTLRVHSNNVATNPNSRMRMMQYVEGGIGAMSDDTTPRIWTLSFWAKSNNGDTTLTLHDDIQVTVTDEWTKFTHTYTNTVSISVMFIFENERVLDMNFAEIQVEYNDTATNFERRPIALELSLCQRYFRKFMLAKVYRQSTIANTTLSGGDFVINPMRVTPSVDGSGINYESCSFTAFMADNTGGFGIRVSVAADTSYSVSGTVLLDAEIYP